MRALVVYESMFGNTRTIAEAIADGIGTLCMVETVEVGDAPAVIGDDIDLLIVGGPTHQFGMSRETSRSEAAKQAERGLISRGIGIREWLDGVQHTSGVHSAAFATRIGSPRWLRLMGSAGKSIEKRLRRLGFSQAAPVEHFHVTGIRGPLVDGEIARAREWGREVALSIAGETDERQAA